MAQSAPAYTEVRWRVQGSDAAWSAPQRVDAGQTEIVISGLDRTTSYEFEARNVADCGARSVWVPGDYTVPTVPPLPLPNVPTTGGVSDGVHLDWGDADASATPANVQYEVQRAPAADPYASTPPPAGDASWSRVAIVAGTAWTDAVTDSNAYWYRVRAVDFRGTTSDWTVVTGPAQALISTPAVNQDLQQAKQALTDVQAQADQVRTDVDATLAQVHVLQGQVGDILQADEWVSTKTYPNGDLVQYSGKLYRSLTDGNINHQPAGATDANWEYIGNYASLGEAVGANAAQVAVLNNTVTQQGNTITANSQSISQQAAQIADKADASALNATNTTVTQQGNTITAMAQDVSLLGAHNTGKTAFVLNQGTVQVDSAGTTLGQYMTSVQAANTAVNARVDSEQSARVTGDAANASAITAVQAQTSGGDLVRKGVFDASLSVGGWSGGGLPYVMNDVNLGYCLAIAGITTESPAIPVTPGDQYDITAKGYSGNIPNGAVLVFGIECTLLDGSINYDAQANGLTNASGIFTLNQRVTIPANAVTAAPFATVLYNNGSAVIFRDLHMTRVTAANKANASAISTLSTTVTNQGGQITANANAINAVTVRMPGGTGTVATAASVTAVQNQVNASWTLALDANGYVSGVKAQNDGSTSSFAVVADQFSIVAPAGGARTEFSSGNWRVYDGAGTLRVQMGVW